MKLSRLFTIGLLPVMLLAGSLAQVAAQNQNFDTLPVAFIGRETGKGADLDQQLYQAAVTAADRINAGEDDDEAGLRTSDGERYNLEIVYYPADTIDNALDALDDAVKDDVIAILGPHDRELAAAVGQADTQGLAILVGASDAPEDETLIQLSTSLADQAAAAADYLVNQRHFTRIGIFASNTDAALNGTQVFRETAGTGSIVADIVREADEDDFSADVRTFRDEEVEALYIYALDSQTENLLAALRDGGWHGEIVFAGLDTAFVEEAGAGLTAGIYGVTGWSYAAYSADSQVFVDAYQAQWNLTPTDAAAAYYDAVLLLAAAVTDAGTDSAAILNSLTNQKEFSGVQGSYDSASTDALRVIQARQDGKFIEAAAYSGVVCQNCTDTWWANTEDIDAASTASFRIGLITTLDGAAEENGEQIEQAARLAVREINEAGGVIGSNNVRYTLDLVSYSASTAESAATAFQQAVSDGVQLVIGPDYNAQIIPNLFRADNEEMVQFVSALSDQVTVNGGSYVYQLRAVDSVLAESAAHYLLDVRELTRFASVAVRTDYGLDGVEAFNDVVADSDDGSVLLRLEHDVDAADFAALADQLVAANVEAVAVWSTQPAARSLMAELETRNWQGVLVYGYLTPDFVTDLTPVSFEVLGSVNWWSTAGDWLSDDFASRYALRYGEAPVPQAATYYDAIYLVAQGLADAGGSGLQTWLNGLEDFTGIQGQYSPGSYATGELSRSVIILGWQQGITNTIARYEDSLCLIGCGS